jgi:hypothetical protein
LLGQARSTGRLGICALIRETGSVAERVRVREIDDDEGERLDGTDHRLAQRRVLGLGGDQLSRGAAEDVAGSVG